MTQFFSDISQFFQYVDSALLLALNGLHNPVLDAVMRAVSMRTVWIPLYLLLFALVWRRHGFKGAVLCLLATLLAVAVADQLCGSWLRGAVGRLRPSNPDNPLSDYVHIVNGYRGGKFGFPSCHAANTAVVAVTLSLWLRRRSLTAWLLGWSALVSLSRIYLGVHYPSDVLVGMAIGSCIAYGLMRLLRLLLPRARRTWPRLPLPRLTW